MKEEGRPLPSEFYNQPELWIESEFYWRAFSQISADRHLGMGLGPIPFSSLLRWAEVYGIGTVDEFDTFSSIVGAIDSEYLKINAPKAEGDNKMRSLVSVSDTAGVGALLDRLGK
jgi:hypothetical protein